MSLDIRMEVVTDISVIQGMYESWNRLLNSKEDALVFGTHLWHMVVGDQFSRQNEAKICCFWRSLNEGGEELIGIVPLRKINRNILGYRYKILNFFTHNRADCQDAIIVKEAAICFDLLSEYLLRQNSSWHLIYLRNIQSESATTAELFAGLDRASLDYIVNPGINCWIVKTSTSFDKYCASLKGKRLSNIRRCERRLREVGEVSIGRISGEECLRDATEQFIELHIKRWGVTSTPSKFRSEVHCEYYRKLFRALHKEGLLDLFYIKLDNKYIGFHFGTRFNGQVLSHTPCFDPVYSKYSPSKILLFHIIKSCFDEKITGFNFLAGDEDYKKEWTDYVQRTSNVFVYRNYFSKVLYDVFFNPKKYQVLRRIKKSI